MSSTRNGALDCSRPAAALFWMLLGCGLALTAQFLQGLPNTRSMLRVGSTSPLRPQIERELGSVAPPNATGHDGQIYYVIARDPFARGPTADVLRSFDLPRYRYRRILFPLLAGGFGQFTPGTTLAGLVFWVVAGMALATLAVADLAFLLRAGGGSVMFAAINLGALLSVVLLTADVLALGLALCGLSLYLRRRLAAALLALALAALTKETYLLVSMGIGLWEWRRRNHSAALALIAVPAMPLAGWSLWLLRTMPEVSRPAAILGVPFTGVGSSVLRWLHPGTLDVTQMVLAVYIIVSVVLSVTILLSRRYTPLHWVIGSWLTLALFAGKDVWVIPSNVARAFSVLWPLGILLLAQRRN